MFRFRAVGTLVLPVALMAFLAPAAAAIEPSTGSGTKVVGYVTSGDAPKIPLGMSKDAADAAFRASGAVQIPSPKEQSLPIAGDAPAPSPSKAHSFETESLSSSNVKAQLVTGTGVVNFQACRSNPLGAGATGVVINHFSFCRYSTFSFLVIDTNGQVKGTLNFLHTEVGEGSQGTREAVVSVELTDFKLSGVVNQATAFKVYKATGSGPDDPECQGGDGQTPYATTVGQAQANGFYALNLKSSSLYGAGDEKTKECLYEWFYTITIPGEIQAAGWHRAGDQSIRFDSASYLPSKAGAIYSRVTPVFSYSRSDMKVKDVADHIYTAFTNPNSTLPAKSNNSPKVIPGNIKVNSLLHRLYPQANPIAQTAYNDNRSAVSRACTPLAHTATQQCDEFPFASTWEGAGVGNGNFSVKYVDGTMNSQAGSALGAWYGRDRILHNDAFGVSIDN